jgi:adenine-specific DNA-methyltransferase
MSIEKLRPSFTFTEDRLHELQQVVPEAFADGKINWDTLREALGEHLEDEEQEHFGLTWPGKREARRLAAMPSKGTLVPVPGEGVNEENTHNIFIEGENLEVLKLLKKSYANRIQMIYIDPPYNTGNDLIYKDDFKETVDSYLKNLGEKDETGKNLTTNIKADGRFHSNWLNMMYPRLFIAHKLLKPEGIIFVSIDDNELNNIKLMLDEIFGEENFVNIVTVKAKPSAGASGGGEDKRLKKNAEFLIIYAKDKNNENMILRFKEIFEEEDLFEHIQSMEEDGKSWKYTSVLTSLGDEEYLTSIKDGSGNEIKLYRRKNYVRTTINALINEMIKSKPDEKPEEIEKKIYIDYLNGIFSDTNAQSSIRSRVMETLGKQDGLFSIKYTPKSGKQKGKITTVYYVGEQKRQVIWLADIARVDKDSVILKGQLSTLWDGFNWNNVAKEGGITFPNGKKPIDFIERIMLLATSGEEKEIIIDFFAGSGSTGHALMDLNSKDNGDRQFILIQIPEKSKKVVEFDNIAELCKQRLRNSINQYEPLFKTNMGFKVYSLGKTQFKIWQTNKDKFKGDAASLFDEFETSLINGWSFPILVSEILLNQGFPLDSSINTLPTFQDNSIQEVTHEFCAHKLYISLDEKIAEKTIEALSSRPEDIFVCLDTALTDEAKLRLSDRCQLKVI